MSVYDSLNQGARWDTLWIKPITRVDPSVANLTRQHSDWAHVGHNTDAIVR